LLGTAVIVCTTTTVPSGVCDGAGRVGGEGVGVGVGVGVEEVDGGILDDAGSEEGVEVTVVRIVVSLVTTGGDEVDGIGTARQKSFRAF